MNKKSYTGDGVYIYTYYLSFINTKTSLISIINRNEFILVKLQLDNQGKKSYKWPLVDEVSGVPNVLIG